MTGPLVPFREIVLKVHSRCDLACDHCYIYEHADQSWRTRPKAISDEAISWTALRLAEHAKTHALPSVSVILHGGEPLLAGPARLRQVCAELTAALDGIAALDLRIHTNGLQLSPRYLDLFDEFGVRVGISLDGDRTANDRHRRYADGRSSHPQVLKAVALLHEERYRHLDLGLLCTIDAANDPLAVYDALAALDPPRIDFLLPHATWDEPPPRPDGSPTAYADWLLTVFDRWEEQGRPMPVRLFESVLSTLAGGPSLTESLGLAPTDLVVVETDGTLEQVDSLKSAYDGAAATGFDVFSHTFDEVAAHPGVRTRQLGLAGVSETCRRCPVVRSCGGGLYTHRYGSGAASGPAAGPAGFDRTSVYCADLEALIRGIESRTAAATTSPAVTDTGELLAAQLDLTRSLLAELHSELAGRGGASWQEAWELAGVVERHSEGLDELLAHPYTRPWLVDSVAALREERPEAPGSARRLAAYVAAAVIRGGLDLAVRVGHRDGALHLPTLGVLRLDDGAGPYSAGAGSYAGSYGDAEVRVVEKGFLVRAGAVERLVVRPGEATPYWRPVRRLGRDGASDLAPDLALDDLDPYRDRFGAPVHPGLGDAEAAGWSARLAAAWGLLRDAVPDQAAEAAGTLSTLTPLLSASTGAVSGPPGYGALGIPVHGDAGELALALLRGFRAAKLRALTEVTDLYAPDTVPAQFRRAPWRDTPVPVSELLAGAYERVGLAAYDTSYRDHARRALDALEGTAELTVSGKSLLAALWKEVDHA
ncbi:radical SAM/SPASM protein FxsB, inactivated metallohydrolase extension form [Streptomyces sp. SID3212]|uniref:radical SAM/SPASM protein FxsBH, inactivated beta-hydroxylase extension form n=1 Tax=Streptomyces sp. SID3212 TaxID=2690259 RepID=UPI00192774FC|nr:radical SAM/SPASM protein FxsB, inactivated metallohydrolase extension form [Streptomyces sp. SID3212]